MVVYKCNKCNKTFNRKSSYDNHLKRKNPCTPYSADDSKIKPNVPKTEQSFQNRNESKFKCEFCHRTYSRKPNLNKHLKICKNKEDNSLKEELFKLLLSNQEAHKKEIN